jgi:hypothetical protein
MPRSLTADDVLPLVACLPPKERMRLLRFIEATLEAEETVYRTFPTARDEFVTDGETLAWDAEGWDDLE